MPNMTTSPDTWSIARNVSPPPKKNSRNRRSSRKNPRHEHSHKVKNSEHNQGIDVAGSGSQFDPDQTYLDAPQELLVSDLVDILSPSISLDAV